MPHQGKLYVRHSDVKCKQTCFQELVDVQALKAGLVSAVLTFSLAGPVSRLKRRFTSFARKLTGDIFTVCG